MKDALDIEEQHAKCSRCEQDITRYGSDGFWFTDRYECGNALHTPAEATGQSWGACGVEDCDECFPLFNEANEPTTDNFGNPL